MDLQLATTGITWQLVAFCGLSLSVGWGIRGRRIRRGHTGRHWRLLRPCWSPAVPTGCSTSTTSPCSVRSDDPSAGACHTWAWLHALRPPALCTLRIRQPLRYWLPLGFYGRRGNRSAGISHRRPACAFLCAVGRDLLGVGAAVGTGRPALLGRQKIRQSRSLLVRYRLAGEPGGDGRRVNRRLLPGRH